MGIGRNQWFRKDPRLIIDGRYPSIRNIKLGERGQLDATVEVRKTRLETGVDNTETLLVEFVIKKVSLVSKNRTEQTTLGKAKTEPIFEAHQFIMPAMGELKIGQKVRVMINFHVVEKTKSLTMLRISYLQPLNTTRIY